MEIDFICKVSDLRNTQNLSVSIPLIWILLAQHVISLFFPCFLVCCQKRRTIEQQPFGLKQWCKVCWVIYMLYVPIVPDSIIRESEKLSLPRTCDRIRLLRLSRLELWSNQYNFVRY